MSAVFEFIEFVFKDFSFRFPRINLVLYSDFVFEQHLLHILFLWTF